MLAWLKRLFEKPEPPPAKPEGRPFHCGTPQAHAAMDYIREKQAKGEPLTDIEQNFLSLVEAPPTPGGISYYPGTIVIPYAPPRKADADPA